MSMLSMSNVAINYGKFCAVRGLNLIVEQGEFVCIVGPNGAGKSSTTLSITGVVKPVAGSIEFNGENIVDMSPEAISRAGIALVPEGRHVFSALSVRENLLMGTASCGGPRGSAQMIEDILELFPILRERLHGTAGKLSGGEQQQLVIGRAMMARPKLMIIDEPSLGLAPKIVDRVYSSLIALRNEYDLTLLVVEQSLERATKTADRIVIMRSGRSILEGSAAEMEHSKEAANAYFGFESGGL